MIEMILFVWSGFVVVVERGRDGRGMVALDRM